jgi:hypothetical protein
MGLGILDVTGSALGLSDVNDHEGVATLKGSLTRDGGDH